VCYLHFAHEAAGATGTRLSLRPLIFEAKEHAQLGRIAPRDGEGVFDEYEHITLSVVIVRHRVARMRAR
jgi:hypothetical protein